MPAVAPLPDGLARQLAQEAQRQQALLAAIHQPEGTGAPPAGWLAWPGPTRQADAAEGVLAYRRNALAGARRALQAAYPVLAQMLGEQALGAVAHHLWQQQPPTCGDLDRWGQALPEHLPHHADAAAWPWLADVARLEWALHRGLRAADTAPGVAGLDLLASADPDRLRCHFAAGATLLTSPWPVVTLWQAHAHGADPAALDGARQALQAGQAEHAWVWRQGWRMQVQALPADWAGFMSALLAATPLGLALRHWPDLDFAAWLTEALRHGWLAAVDNITMETRA